MGKGFNFVHERKRIRMRVFRRIFFPKFVTIDGVSHKIFVDTLGQKEIDYEDSKEYDLDSPLKQASFFRLAQASNSANCILDESGIVHCKIFIGTSEEITGKSIDRVKWLPFNPDRLISPDEREKKIREQSLWKRQLKA